MSSSIPSGPTDICVIGAGIVGLCTALFLQRAGFSVTVFDEGQPGGASSYGNGGLLSPHSCMPMSMPGMLTQVPKWLLKRDGPLALDPAYALTAAPWLTQWVRAGTSKQLERSASALNSLHSNAIDIYRDLLGPDDFRRLIRTTGQVHVWESPVASKREEISAAYRARFGIKAEVLSRSRLRDMVPALTTKISRALYYPGAGHTVSPLQLARTVAEKYVEAGGFLVNERIHKVIPTGTGYRLLASCRDVIARRVVVSAGAWSSELLQPLQVQLPLEAERGYHVELLNASICPEFPVLNQDRAFGAIQMENGLRFAGWVDIAGMVKVPDERRGDAMLAQALDMFPGLTFEKRSFWMGFRPGTPDSLPVLSQVDQHPGVFVATGHGHTGVTAGAVSGLLMSQLISGAKPLVDIAPFSLNRFH